MGLIARALATSVALMTLIGSNIADWNTTHIFSELWSPHSRFHGAWFVVAVSLLSLLSLWLAWSRAPQPDHIRISILIQASIWLAFFAAMLVPQTRLADPTKEVELAGVDLNLIGAVGALALLAAAWWLLERDRRS